MMNTVQQMSSFEFQMVCAVRLILASCCGLCIGIERTNRLKDAGIRRGPDDAGLQIWLF